MVKKKKKIDSFPCPLNICLLFPPVGFSPNGQRQLPFGCDPAADILPGQHLSSDWAENTTAGSLVEHQRSVTAEQLYDHALYSTMLLYHGS